MISIWTTPRCRIELYVVHLISQPPSNPQRAVSVPSSSTRYGEEAMFVVIADTNTAQHACPMAKR